MVGMSGPRLQPRQLRTFRLSRDLHLCRQVVRHLGSFGGAADAGGTFLDLPGYRRIPRLPECCPRELV